MNRRNTLQSVVLVAALAASTLAGTAFAQGATGGRTDGPEGSEIGHGGYSRSGSGVFSLQLDFGASFPSRIPTRVPLFTGLTAGFWMDEWFVLDLSALYAFDQKTEVLVGPRFRTVTYPVSLNAGLKGGLVLFPGLASFGLVPQVGLDLVANDHLLFGLNYAIDLAFVPSTFAPNNVLVGHRVFMSVGYRF